MSSLNGRILAIAEIALPDGRRDADNGNPPRRLQTGRRIGHQLDATPERIFAGEVHRHQPLIDDADLVAGGTVGVGKRPAARQGQPEGIEVPRSDRYARDLRRRLTGHLAPIDRQPQGHATAEADEAFLRIAPVLEVRP